MPRIDSRTEGHVCKCEATIPWTKSYGGAFHSRIALIALLAHGIPGAREMRPINGCWDQSQPVARGNDWKGKGRSWKRLPR